MTRVQYVAEVRSMLGTPWVHQGRLKGVGLDCIGVVGMAALACGSVDAAEWESAPEFHNYGRQPDAKVLVRGCERFMVRIQVGEAGLGDVLIIRFETEPMHFAIVSRLNPMYVIHGLASAGKVVEHRFDPTWTNRIVRAYRLRDIQ